MDRLASEPLARAVEPASGAVRRLAPHVLILATFYLVVQFLLGSGISTVDEGVYLMQSKWLEQGYWSEEIPASSYGGSAEDPLVAVPVTSGTVLGNGQWVVYPRHPAYPVMIAGSQRLMGDVGPPFVSIVAAILASIVMALSVPRHRVLAFWLSAFATPLFFHAHVVWAHTLGVFAAAVTMYAVCRYLSSGLDRAVVVGLLVGPALVLLMRTEGLLFALAVVGVLSLNWLVSDRNWRGIAAPVAASIGMVIGFAVDTLWRASVLNGRVVAAASTDLSVVTLGERLRILSDTILGFGDGPIPSLARLILVASLIAGAVAIRRGQTIPPLALLLPVACAIIGSESPNRVGLLVAAPVVLFGVVGAKRTRETIVLLSIALLSTLAIAGTIYQVDAGRVMLLAVPSLVVVGTPAIAAALKDNRWMVAATAAVIIGSPMYSGLRLIDTSHSFSTEMANELESFTTEHEGALFLAVELRTGRVAWDLHPVGIATTTPEKAGDYLVSHTEDEVWIVGTGIGLSWLEEQVPVGWAVDSTYDGEAVNAVLISPSANS